MIRSLEAGGPRRVRRSEVDKCSKFFVDISSNKEVTRYQTVSQQYTHSKLSNKLTLTALAKLYHEEQGAERPKRALAAVTRRLEKNSKFLKSQEVYIILEIMIFFYHFINLICILQYRYENINIIKKYY